jgi:glycosyltransferase 2 family protein
MNTTNPEISRFPDLAKFLKKGLIILPIGVLINLALVAFNTPSDRAFPQTSFHLQFLLIAVLLALLPWFIHSIRMKNWTHCIQNRLSFGQSFKITLGMDMGAALSPTALGGGPVKAAMLMGEGISPGKALSLTLLASMEDFIFFTGMFFYLLIWKYEQVNYFWNALLVNVQWDVIFIYGAAVLFLLILTGIIYNTYRRDSGAKKYFSRSEDFFKKLFIDLKNTIGFIQRHGKLMFLINTLLSGIQWTSKYLIIYFILLGLGIHLSPSLLFFQQMVVYLLLNFVPTPGAVAGAEAVFILIFRSVLSDEMVYLVKGSWRFLTFYLQLSISVLIFTLLHYRRLWFKKMI